MAGGVRSPDTFGDLVVPASLEVLGVQALKSFTAQHLVPVKKAQTKKKKKKKKIFMHNIITNFWVCKHNRKKGCNHLLIVK